MNVGGGGGREVSVIMRSFYTGNRGIIPSISSVIFLGEENVGSLKRPPKNRQGQIF